MSDVIGRADQSIDLCSIDSRLPHLYPHLKKEAGSTQNVKVMKRPFGAVYSVSWVSFKPSYPMKSQNEKLPIEIWKYLRTHARPNGAH